jgi:hypothetical protein
LRCPGCYAYEDGHVGGLNLRQLQDKCGEDLVQGVLALVDEHRPLHLSLEACIFAQTTHTISADLKRKITPCQFGGNPDCSQCGCFASMGLAAVGNYKLALGVTAGDIYWASSSISRALPRTKRAA